MDFFLNILFLQAQAAISLITSEKIETILSPIQLAVWEYLQTVSEATPREIVDRTGMARSSINKTIMKLLKLKKIERLGLARGIRYRKLSN